MSEPRKLKVIVDEVAQTFGVTAGRVWDTVKRAVSGFGVGWESRPYATRAISSDEAREFNLPASTVVVCNAGDGKPRLFIRPSCYKDKDQIERPTVSAYSHTYLKAVSLKSIKLSDWVPEDELSEDDEEDRGP
jgi:hypothetical protein